MRLPSLLIPAALAAFALGGHAFGQDADPILAKLDEAKQAYETSEETFRKAVVDRLNAAEERAIKAGKKAAADQAVADRSAFEATGALPKSLKVTDLEGTRARARINLQAAFTKAVSELTKNRRRDEADAVEAEAAAFKAKLTGDLVKPGSVWRGVKRYTKGGRPGDHPFEFRVTDRSGEAIKGVIAEDEMSHDVEGTVNGDKVEWRITRIRTGSFPGQSASGTFEGEQMKLHFARRQAPGGGPVEADAVLKVLKKK